jgi:Na+/melibiose symporter-like transporter
MTRVKSYKNLVLWGGAVGVAALLVLGFGPGALPYWLVEVLIFVHGAGVGIQFPVATISVQNAVEAHDLGSATATLSFLRSLGSVLGVAVLGSVLLSSGVVQSLGEGVHAHAAMHTPAAIAAAAQAFSALFFAAAGFLVIGQIIFLFVEERPLRSSAHVAVSREIPMEV